jgi:hypothetical protein
MSMRFGCQQARKQSSAGCLSCCERLAGSSSAFVLVMSLNRGWSVFPYSHLQRGQSIGWRSSVQIVVIPFKTGLCPYYAGSPVIAKIFSAPVGNASATANEPKTMRQVSTRCLLLLKGASSPAMRTSSVYLQDICKHMLCSVAAQSCTGPSE